MGEAKKNVAELGIWLALEGLGKKSAVMMSVGQWSNVSSWF
jgi:hypothetical protein